MGFPLPSGNGDNPFLKMVCDMKKLFLVFVIVLTIATMVFSNVALAFSEDVLDNPDYTFEQDGIVYKEKTTTYNGNAQKLFYGEYNSTADNARYEWVIHSVRNDSTTTLNTVMDIAKDYEQTTGRKVMLATNGDYFYNTGANVDSYVNNGIVISKGNFVQKNCIGFDNNGKVVVGRMTDVAVRIAVYDEDGNPQFYPIDKFNEQPEEGEIAIYDVTGSYNLSNVGVSIAKTDSTNIKQYPVWGTNCTMTKAGVYESKSFKVSGEQFAVVYTSTHQEVFDKNVYGHDIDIVEIPQGEYEGCTWVLGGYDVLVNNYTVNADCHSDNAGDSNAPRTFIGFKEDGTAFLCVLDGRQPGYAVGVTVNQEAQLAGALGARFALELDGGGSSTMVVRIDDELVVRNLPSDGSERKVSNAIMLVEVVDDEQPTNPNPDDNNPEQPEEPSTPEQPNENPPFITTDLIIAIVLCVVVVIGSVVAFIVLINRKQ